MALPLLDSMIPTFPALAATKAPVRLGYMYTPNGIVGASTASPRPNMWTPKTAGTGFEFMPTMKALEPYRDQINVFSNLAQVNGRALGDGGGDHARATLYLPDRRASVQDGRRGLPPGYFRRPDCCKGARKIHPALLTGDRP